MALHQGTITASYYTCDVCGCYADFRCDLSDVDYCTMHMKDHLTETPDTEKPHHELTALFITGVEV